MKSNKIYSIFAVLILAVFVFGLLGCSSDNAKTASEPSKTVAPASTPTKASVAKTTPAASKVTPTSTPAASGTPTTQPNVITTVDTQKLDTVGITTSTDGVTCPTVKFPDTVTPLAPTLNADGKKEVVINELDTAKLVLSDNYQLARTTQLRCIEDGSSYACGQFLIRKYTSGDINNAEYAYFKTFKVQVVDTINSVNSISNKVTAKVKLAVVQSSCAKADVKDLLK